MAGRFKIEAIFKGVDKLSAPLRRMQNRVGKFARKAKRGFKSVSRAFTAMNQKLKSGALMAGVAIAGLSVAIRSLIMTSADFGRAIGSASVKFPENIKRGTLAFKELEDTAKEVGRTTEFTATEAGKGLGFLAKAGYTAKFSMKALSDIVNFATASELELGVASDIASDAMGAFNMNAKDPIQKLKNINRIMDVMALTSIRSNTSVEELFETMKKGAPVAEASGASIETYSAIMGILAGSGIKGGIAGTSAKRLFLALTGIGGKAPAVMKKLGIATADANGNIRDQFDILDDLFKKLDGMKNQKKRLGLIEQLFGKIPLASANILLRDGTKNLRKLRKEFEGGAGASKRMASEIRNDLKGSIDSLMSAIEAVKLKAVDSYGMKGIIDGMVEWTRANEDMIASGIMDGLDKLIVASKFLWKNGDKIIKVAGAYVALAVGLKAVGMAITVIDLALKASAFSNIVTFFILWGTALGVGVDRMRRAVEASQEISKAMGNMGRSVEVPTGNAPLAPDPKMGGSRQPAIPSDSVGNQNMSIDFKNAPPWVDIKNDDGEQLNTGYSGGVN